MNFDLVVHHENPCSTAFPEVESMHFEKDIKKIKCGFPLKHVINETLFIDH